jgi:hypothetical protein
MDTKGQVKREIVLQAEVPAAQYADLVGALQH